MADKDTSPGQPRRAAATERGEALHTLTAWTDEGAA